VVTLQQVSSQSPYYETYTPYLEELAAYVRKCVPKAKIAIHQTWAYEQDSKRLNEELGYKDQAEMFRDIQDAYRQAAKDIAADLIIPSGEVFQKMIAAGEKVHRDTFHASFGLGRYALGLLWYAMLTGRGVVDHSFRDFDEEIPPQKIILAKQSVGEITNNYCR